MLKQFNFAIKSGIEQRYVAIKIGAKGATTLLYKDAKFVMPSAAMTYDPLKNEPPHAIEIYKEGFSDVIF